MTNSRKIIVICPIRNEEWILEQFLKACSQFADHIVLGDHFSNDSSLSIAAKYKKVKIITAESNSFTERERRNQLLIEARKLASEALIFSLDADEILSPNLEGNLNFASLCDQPKGTQFTFPFFNIGADLSSGWFTNSDPIAFIDDGSIHEHAETIHFPRLPNPNSVEVIQFTNATILHLQYVDWRRMLSKHRWYRIWERINFPNKPAIEIYRRYHHMDYIAKRKRISTNLVWLQHLSNCGADLEKISEGLSSYWWDFEVQKTISTYPKDLFKRIDPDVFARQELDSLSKFFWIYAELTQRIVCQSNWSPARIFVRLVDKTIFSRIL